MKGIVFALKYAWVAMLALPIMALCGVLDPWKPAAKHFADQSGQMSIMISYADRSSTFQDNGIGPWVSEKKILAEYILLPSFMTTNKIEVAESINDGEPTWRESDAGPLPLELILTYCVGLISTYWFWIRPRWRIGA